MLPPEVLCGSRRWLASSLFLLLFLFGCASERRYRFDGALDDEGAASDEDVRGDDPSRLDGTVSGGARDASLDAQAAPRPDAGAMDAKVGTGAKDASADARSGDSSTLDARLDGAWLDAAPDAARDASPSLDARAPDAQVPDAQADAAGSDAGSSADAGADAGDGATFDPRIAHLRILALNDFMAALFPPSAPFANAESIPAGGLVYLAAELGRFDGPNTVVVSDGNIVGETALPSPAFADEPAIEAMNLLGLDYSAVGTAELIQGVAELERWQSGGCGTPRACPDATPYPGARFKYLSANIEKQSPPGTPLFPAFEVRRVDGVDVAFIGVSTRSTVRGAPGITGALRFREEAAAVNALIPALHARGVHAIIVLLHEHTRATGGRYFNGCEGLSGPALDIVEQLHNDVDLVIAGQGAGAFRCVVRGKQVTSAFSHGRMFTRVELAIDRASGALSIVQVENHVVGRRGVQDPTASSFLAGFEGTTVWQQRQVGQVSADISRSQTPAGDSPFGLLMADALREYAAPFSAGLPTVALMHNGAVRFELRYNEQGLIHFGHAFVSLWPDLGVIAQTFSGAQLQALLEQQFQSAITTSEILHPSSNLQFAYSTSAPIGSRIRAVSIDGAPLLASAQYRVITDTAVAEGGDGFTQATGGLDADGPAGTTLDALLAYLRAHSPVAPPPTGRITRLP